METLKTVFAALRQGILMIFACLVVFAIGEVAVRSYAALYMDGTSFFRTDVFITPWITGSDYPPPRIRADGSALFRHRIEPTSVAKPPGVTRIIAVGGSTTANEFAFERTGKDYAVLLEGLLNQGVGSQEYEVLNAGAGSFSSAHSLINIQLRLLEFAPDVIILMHNVNDLSVSQFGRGATSDYANKYMLEYYLNSQLQAGLSIKGFLNQSRLLSAAGLTKMPRDILHYDNPIDDGLRYFERNLRNIAAICKAHDVKLVLLSQPHRLAYNEDGSTEIRVRAFNEKIRQVSEDTGALFIDMFDAMGHETDLFFDEVHYSPLGLHKFSRILHQRLKDRL